MKDADLRDHFAGLAMQAFIRTQPENGGPASMGGDLIAQFAYETADAMLLQRAIGKAKKTKKSAKHG